MSSRPAASANPSATVTAEILTIDRIQVSPLNVRRHRATINAVAAMEASILGRGLIQPLNLHPLKGTAKFGAFAGGRRARAIQNLVDRGDLPADYPVRVEIYRGYSDIEIIEVSLGENILRQDLEKYEICAAIRALDARGEPLEAIARALGQALPVVRRWHRVGALAEPIFTAFAEEKISEDEARAYAATADPKLQLAVFEQLRGLPEDQRTPERIRAAMKIGDRQLGKFLRLVGEDAYRAAGGRFELDLFAGEAEQRGRIVDEDKLRALADARLDEVRAATRAEAGRDLRFVPKPPANSAGYTDYTLQVTPRSGKDGKLAIPEGEIVAAIELSEAGEPQVTYWWGSRKAKFGPGAKPAPRPEHAHLTIEGADALRYPEYYAAPAKAAIKDEHGVSADALATICSVHLELLRALVVEDADRYGAIGRDFAVWVQLRVLLGRDSPASLGARCASRSGLGAGVAFAALRAAEEHVEQYPAHDVWSGAVRTISALNFITEDDPAGAFLDFVNSGEPVKKLAGAVLAGLILERGANAPGFHFAAHDALARMTRGTPATLRRLWSPTAEFLALLPKAQLLAIAEPLVGAETFARWGKAKAAELPDLLAQALAGGGNAIATRNRQAAAEWVHPLLAFRDFDYGLPSAEPVEAAA